jgi:hypothetical protein
MAKSIASTNYASAQTQPMGKVTLAETGNVAGPTLPTTSRHFDRPTNAGTQA